MKKFLFVHDISQADILNNMERMINNFSNWTRCFSDWQNTTEAEKWSNLTIEKCQNFEYVMFLLLTDEREDKLNKFWEIVSFKDRTYKTIIYCDGVVGWQCNPFSVPNKKKYMDIISASDYIFHYGLPESEGYWRVITRDRESFNIDRPHPVEIAKTYDIEHPLATEYIKQFALKERKDIIVIGKSLKNINEERNAISSLYIASKLQKRYGWTVMVFANNPLPTNEKDRYYKEICGLNEVLELPIMNWNDYIKVLSLAKIGIHLDCLETRGQFPLDCGCLRIPVVCSGSIAGFKLFPDTWLAHCRNITKALELAYKLVEDKKFHDKVVDYAYNKVEDYSFVTIKKKLEKILGTKI